MVGLRTCYKTLHPRNWLMILFVMVLFPMTRSQKRRCKTATGSAAGRSSGREDITGENMTIQNIKLLEEVNPVFTTAQACLLVMAEAGDADAEKLVSKLGFDRGIASVERDALTEIEKFQRMKKIPGFTTMIEARFTASTGLIRSSRIGTAVDLPCGYTPRGLQFSQSGTAYYGLDLPAVIGAMDPACRELYRGETPPHYHAVDATNYDSLRSALNGAKGELFITTEGLLMYLTQSELEEVFYNISGLLEEYGGHWVTTDNMIVTAQEKVAHALCPEGTMPPMPANAPKPENIFFDPGQAETFVKNMGFTLKKTAVYDYLPERLNTLGRYPEEVQKRAREALREMYFWIMQPDRASVKKHIDSNNRFEITSRKAGHTQFLSLRGRLDTLTAPDLLALYREENEKGSSDRVDIDMKNLEYISSAGLRVLLIMVKDRPEQGSVTLRGLNSTVKAVIMDSGFDGLVRTV